MAHQRLCKWSATHSLVLHPPCVVRLVHTRPTSHQLPGPAACRSINRLCKRCAQVPRSLSTPARPVARAFSTTAASAAPAPPQQDDSAIPTGRVKASRPVYDYKGTLEQVVGCAKHVLRDAQGRLSLKNLTLKQLEAWCAAIGEPKRAMQLWRWMYADKNWVHALQETVGAQNGISQAFLDKVDPLVTCDGGLELQQVVRSKDGTRKLVFKLTGGEAAGGTVETVLIPVVRSAGQKARITLCVSTQVGCAQNCQFCYTGRMGLLGNLTTAQIVEQVVEARRFMAQEGDKTPLTNCVFMGMGEPLHNPEAVADAIEIMHSHLGLHMSHNKVTVSTVGLIPEIRRFAARTNAQLAVSLHATTDEVRDWVVPINRRYPLSQLMATLRELYPLNPPEELLEPRLLGQQGQGHAAQQAQHEAQPAAHMGQHMGKGNVQGSHVAQQGQLSESDAIHEDAAQQEQHRIRWALGQKRLKRTGPVPPGRNSHRDPRDSFSSSEEEERLLPGTLLIAYTMLRGINDTPEDAHRLLELLDGVAAKVNLIVFNPHEGTTFLPSTDEAVQTFRSILVRGGRVCTIRNSRGDDEMAACGQLGDPGLSWKPAPIIEPPARFKELLRQQQEEFRQERLAATPSTSQTPVPV